MEQRVLVAGATGALGQLVCTELIARGYRVSALSRSATRAAPLAESGASIVVADALQPATLAELCGDVDIVFSCLGQSVSLDTRIRGPGYHAVDYVANRNLLDAARTAEVGRFVYVSVFGAERFGHLAYVRAHEAVVRELRASGMRYGVIRPTGFFATLAALLDFAERGVGMLFGDGSARSNPIHEADLAAICADIVAAPESIEVDAGGPEVLTRRTMSELAFAAIDRTPRFVSTPPWLVGPMSALAYPFAPRIAELLQFAVAMYTNDVIAPAVGTRTLGAYFQGYAARR
jgi:uncharacterized protein YbjT (DUF2867 family)